jgi:hypothetical protein
MIRPRLAALVAGALTVGMTSAASWAAGPLIKVGNGTAASCTETALTNALLAAEARGGATIRFRCGSNSVTIAIADLLWIPDNTTVDGDDLITLHGTTDDGAVLAVDIDAAATLKSLTVISPRSLGVFNAGTLTVTESTFTANSGVCGGGIHNNGTLTLRNSTLTGGYGFFQGGGLCNFGIAAVHNVVFSNNGGGGGGNGGGAIWNAGTLTVTDSTFTHNTSFGDVGGAIYNGGRLTVRTSVFFQNHGGAGGAIFNDGPGHFVDGPDTGQLTVRDTVMIENSVADALGSFGAHGGGIYNRGGAVNVNNSAISENTAAAPGGGVYTCCGGTTTLKKTEVSGNTPDNVVTVP